MIQTGSTVPTLNLNQFYSRRSSLRSQASPLNPNLKRTTSSSSRSTQVHLANLEKLLAKPPLPEKLPEPPRPGKSLLDGLNLARLWPPRGGNAAAAEEMSPRHLGRLQQLLSGATEESSPRNVLGRRWRQYHGSNDWSGLLDPLDENLRREVVRYGEFVQAAYRCFHSNPATSPDSPPSPRHVALPDRSYRVTKSLYATSSVGLPKWVDDAAPELGWMTQRSSWVGYVAVCDDPREIQRMGRRDIVIALRGTATCLEWAENMRANLVEMPDSESSARVEAGFLSLYKTQGAHIASLAESVVEEIKRLMETYKGEELSITVTGHSLGAALAVLVGDELGSNEDAPPIAVFSFGGPRVGNRGLAEEVETKKVKVLRIVNSQDVVTRVPATSLSYWDIGTELRVDTKMSPYLKPNADMACCHDLEAYLHLVDGFLASNCPFRSNAKRSLARLLHDQGSNVKKLYTSKAKSLSLNLERDLHRCPIALSLQTCLPSPSS